MVPNPISLSDVLAFIGLFGPPATVDIETFVDLIGQMDLKYLELNNGDSGNDPG